MASVTINLNRWCKRYENNFDFYFECVDLACEHLFGMSIGEVADVVNVDECWANEMPPSEVALVVLEGNGGFPF